MTTVLYRALLILSFESLVQSLHVFNDGTLPNPSRPNITADLPLRQNHSKDTLQLLPGDHVFLDAINTFVECPSWNKHDGIRLDSHRSDYCRLEVCMLNGPQAPRLYAGIHPAGHGYKMLTLLTAMAVATRNGMNFGGLVVQDPNSTKSHSSDFMDILIEFLGPEYKDIFITQDAAPEAWDGIYTQPPKVTKVSNVFLSKSWDLNSISRASNVLAMLRKSQLQRPVPSRSTNPLVVLHVRRGDLHPDSDVVKASPNSYFYKMVEMIKQDLPHADVHVFSTLEIWHVWNRSCFDGFEERGMHVHLDEVGPGMAWSYMSRADVLVMSPSTFSLAPATLNPNCIVGTNLIKPGEPYMWLPSGRDGSWKNDPTHRIQVELSQCIHSIVLNGQQKGDEETGQQKEDEQTSFNWWYESIHELLD